MSKDAPSSSTEFHSALTVNNIRNAVPVILDYENIQYADWVELFENHLCAHNLLHHIDPHSPRPADISDSLWRRLDAVVKQWIYGTISSDLLKIILSRKSTAQQAWDRLKEIFQDNKTSRALYLEHQFNNLHLHNFPNCTASGQQIKSLADQLANIDHNLTEQKMVIVDTEMCLPKSRSMIGRYGALMSPILRIYSKKNAKLSCFGLEK
ncbi:Retrovirus-related Pol polyprotein from transposon TNT 1-94 [Bienertia sinuspersici]